MGTWNSGIFDNDEALDFVGELIQDLWAKVEGWFQDDDPRIEDDGEGMVIPSIAIINLLCEQCGACPPKADVVAEWRTKYLRAFDEQIEELSDDDEYKLRRREVVYRAFKQLETNSKQFWDKAARPAAPVRSQQEIGARGGVATVTPVSAPPKAKPPTPSKPSKPADDDEDLDDDDDSDDDSGGGASSGARRFEFSEGTSNKFWEISLSGKSFTVRFGRIGTNGQEQTKSFPTTDKAKVEYDKLVAEKIKKGYEEVEADE